MKTRLKTILTGMVSLLAGPTFATEPLLLQYEYSPTAAGPYGPVPTDMINVNPDGSAHVLPAGQSGFFRVKINSASNPAGSGGSTVPAKSYASLPAGTKVVVEQLWRSIAEEDSEEGASWKYSRLSPFVTPMFSPWNETGEPDLVEIKVVGTPEPPSSESLTFPNGESEATGDRGFIIAGLTRQSLPIVGYRTDGSTTSEDLLARSKAGHVAKIYRFGPMSLVAVDLQNGVISNNGLLPTLSPESTYAEQGQKLSLQFTENRATNPALPVRQTTAVRSFNTFGDLLAAHRTSPMLTRRKELRQAAAEREWDALEGKLPSLTLKAGARQNVLTEKIFTAVSVDDEESPGALIATLRPTGGLTLSSTQTTGAFRLTVTEGNGDKTRYNVVVEGAAPVQLRSVTNGVCTTSQMWQAGPTDGQPRFSQRSDLNRWCDAVGCGPVMLAIMIAWAEHNQNVPSAYWNLSPSASQAERRKSLRDVDSPMLYIKGITNSAMRKWYDTLHDWCDVTCWPHNGSGSTLPGDAADALEEYFNMVTSAGLPLSVGDSNSPLVSGSWDWENSFWGDDWEDSGKKVANAIKAGRPGGVYYMEYWHYAVAWRYRLTTHKVMSGGKVVSTSYTRLFRVNTGWGNGSDQDAVWNALDIDGCYLLNLKQDRLGPN